MIDLNNMSKFDIFKTLPQEEKIKRIKKLSDIEAEILMHDPDWLARPKQRFPERTEDNFFPYIWLINAGRGFGKTQVLSWWINHKAKNHERIILIGATETDLIDVLVNGKSGILESANKYERPKFKNKKLYWPNGAKAELLSSQEPDRARGRQSSILAFDEFASYPYLQDMWDMLIMGHRLTGKNGEPPQIGIATTPRPVPLIREIVKKSKTDNSIIITSGSSFENKANLDKRFIQKIEEYDGTRIGRQEIYGEILEENENALWTYDLINKNRINDYVFENEVKLLKDIAFVRIIVAIDPAVTSGPESDMTGIVVCAKGEDGHYYVLEDISLVAKPNTWASAAINIYHNYKADLVVAETNNGGDLVENTIKNLDSLINYKKVTATRGKVLRAEPISALYEINKVHHVGKFEHLEKQMVEYNGDPNSKSPDRLDALVWALTELSNNNGGGWLDIVDEYNTSNKKPNIVNPDDLSKDW